MRLWDYKILPYLPKSQLLSQKRECDLIWKDISNGKQTNHILINYMWEYDIEDFVIYYCMLQDEFKRRNFNFNSNTYFNMLFWAREFNLKKTPFEKHHTNRYLIQCFFNLQEKYERGQKDFSLDVYTKLKKFIEEDIL